MTHQRRLIGQLFKTHIISLNQLSVKLRISVTCISFVYVVIFDFTDPVIYNYNMNSNVFFIREGLGFYVIFKIATGLKNEDYIDKGK